MWSDLFIKSSAVVLLLSQITFVAARECVIWQDLGPIWREVDTITPPTELTVFTKRHGTFVIDVLENCTIFQNTKGALRATWDETD
ncbi:hypothetical protein OOU_Y34scaffold00505g1 [Pyricularia oryzae Y34]|uniref:Uncharacterized protein n=2 Tax=Pyricularia oryzae TaxID=318829 RepID=A0AA97PLP8_PYRO3|nr:hypothetical protein OOU_Y34scaffold00505g1 [Pyricularia oryzae Y34]